MSVLSLQNISFSYGKTPVLKDISYEFEKGKMYCIIGKSGAGKTTLLSLLSGLAAPNSGEIIFDGKNVAKIDKYTFRSRYIGVVFQSFNLITKYTALENVTPDVTWRGEVLDCGWWKVGEENIGIPYGWGNASTLEAFETGLREGKYAGNVPEDKSRYGSYQTVGVDCSGLLTVCWGLEKKIATRDIPQYAYAFPVTYL